MELCLQEGGNTSWWQRLFREVRCRQPEKILSLSQLPVLIAHPGKPGSLVDGEQSLLTGISLVAGDESLAYPACQAFGGRPEPFSD